MYGRIYIVVFYSTISFHEYTIPERAETFVKGLSWSFLSVSWLATPFDVDNQARVLNQLGSYGAWHSYLSSQISSQSLSYGLQRPALC